MHDNENAWEELQARQDYMEEAYGSSVPNGQLEAYYNYCDAMELESTVPMSFQDWKTRCATNFVAAVLTPVVDNSDIPF